MPFLVTSRKIWPILLGLLLCFGLEEALDATGAHRLADGVAFAVVLVTGIICVVVWLKDIYWDK